MNVAAVRARAIPFAPSPRAREKASRAARRVRAGARPSRFGRAGLAAAVTLAHAAGVAGLVYIGLHATIPDMTVTSPRPIEVAFVAPEVQAAPKPPQPAPPQPVKVEMPPPVPVKPKKAPAPKPVPAVEPLKVPEQAISEPKPEPPAAAEAAPVAEAALPAAPAAQATAAAVGPVATAPVTAARFDADYLHNPAPAYPAMSRRMREEGRVLLRVLVSALGAPVRVELARSSNSSRLDEAARDAVGRWRFVPARRGEQAIEAWVQVPIVFNLEGK